MNILKAIEKALAIDGHISRRDLRRYLKIKPTDTEKNCILMHWDGSRPTSKGWNAKSDDLLAEDWFVVEEEEDLDILRAIDHANRISGMICRRTWDVKNALIPKDGCDPLKDSEGKWWLPKAVDILAVDWFVIKDQIRSVEQDVPYDGREAGVPGEDEGTGSL